VTDKIPHFAGSGNVSLLVDDWKKYGPKFLTAGGCFVHYTEQSLTKIKDQLDFYFRSRNERVRRLIPWERVRARKISGEESTPSSGDGSVRANALDTKAASALKNSPNYHLVIIVRGLPGTGKRSLCRFLRDEIFGPENTEVISASDGFSFGRQEDSKAIGDSGRPNAQNWVARYLTRPLDLASSQVGILDYVLDRRSNIVTLQNRSRAKTQEDNGKTEEVSAENRNDSAQNTPSLVREEGQSVRRLTFVQSKKLVRIVTGVFARKKEYEWYIENRNTPGPHDASDADNDNNSGSRLVEQDTEFAILSFCPNRNYPWATKVRLHELWKKATSNLSANTAEKKTKNCKQGGKKDEGANEKASRSPSTGSKADPAATASSDVDLDDIDVAGVKGDQAKEVDIIREGEAGELSKEDWKELSKVWESISTNWEIDEREAVVRIQDYDCD
jgi:hypothetical protein